VMGRGGKGIGRNTCPLYFLHRLLQLFALRAEKEKKEKFRGLGKKRDKLGVHKVKKRQLSFLNSARRAWGNFYGGESRGGGGGGGPS